MSNYFFKKSNPPLCPFTMPVYHGQQSGASTYIREKGVVTFDNNHDAPCTCGYSSQGQALNDEKSSSWSGQSRIQSQASERTLNCGQNEIYTLVKRIMIHDSPKTLNQPKPIFKRTCFNLPKTCLHDKQKL